MLVACCVHVGSLDVYTLERLVYVGNLLCHVGSVDVCDFLYIGKCIFI